MESESQFQPQQRLHPLSWLFALLAFVRQFVVPLALAFLFGARGNYELWGLIGAIPLLAFALWHQYSYRYGFGPGGLVIREGLVFRNVRQVEYGRIVNIDTSRGPLHRLLGVAEVKIETSAGGKAEAVIRVLGPAALSELRERVFTRGGQGTAEETPADAVAPLLHLPAGELVRFGLIDNRGTILVAAMAGALYQMGLGEALQRFVADQLPGAVNELGSLSWPLQAALALGAVIGALLSVRALSVVMALITLHDFRLARQGSDLRAQFGLITRIALTLRLPRIQALHQTESLLHRLFGRVSLHVDLAGDGGEQGEQQASRMRWLAPVTTPAYAPSLIASALPALDFSVEPSWQPLAPRARRRVFRRTALWASMLLLAPAGWFVGVWAPAIVLVTVPFSALHARLYVRHTHWALTSDALLFRSGWLTHRLVIAPRNRVQSVHLTESPFDRRHGMAAVAIDAAGGSTMADLIRIPMLERHTALSLAEELYRQSRSSV